MKYKQEKEHKDTRRKKQQIEIKIFPIIVILVMVVITVFLVIGRKQERMRASIVGKQRYATSNNSHAEIDSTQESCIITYEYIDTTGDGRYNICKVTVRTKESWYFNNVPSDWEQKSDQEIEKVFIENEDITIQCIYASEPIRINPNKIGSYSIPVTGIHIDKSIATITIGDTLTLKATVTPEDAINKKIIWTSSNESIATVNGHGVVTAKAQGKASITAKTEDGEKTTKCEVTVVDKIDKPIEPDEPTEPSQPIEPDEPTEPNNPVGPNEPIDPNDPISPDRPSDIDNSSNFGDLIGGSQSNKRNDSEETKWATNKDKNEYFYSPTKLPSTGNRKIGRMFIMLLGVLTVMVTFIKYKTYKIK